MGAQTDEFDQNNDSGNATEQAFNNNRTIQWHETCLRLAIVLTNTWTACLSAAAIVSSVLQTAKIVVNGKWLEALQTHCCLMASGS